MVVHVLAPTSIFKTGNDNDFWQMNPFLPKNDRQERSSNWEDFVWEIYSTFFSSLEIILSPNKNDWSCFDIKEYF